MERNEWRRTGRKKEKREGRKGGKEGRKRVNGPEE